MRRSITALAVLLGMAGTGVAAAQGASAATTCNVVDSNSDQSYTSLQDAVTTAAPGDTLFVKGTCTGTTEISKNLTISGHSASGAKTASLDGGGQDTVLTIDSGVTLTLNTLIITGGGTASGNDAIGGGINTNGATVTLNGATVTGNTAGRFGAGGIYNASGRFGSGPGGTVTLNDSTITGNTAPSPFDTGGIDNNGTLIVNGTSSVSNNNTGSTGGGIFNSATLIVNDSATISGNTALACAGIENFATAAVNDSATITGNMTNGTNTNTANGGGICNYGTLTLNGTSSISNNTADGGGGIFNIYGTLTLNGTSSISNNTAAVRGGGIFNTNGATVTLNGATITGNTASGTGNSGGGIFNCLGGTLNGAVAGTGGNVYNNTPDDIAGC